MKTISVRVLNRAVISLSAPLKLADPADAFRVNSLNVAPKDRVPKGEMPTKMRRVEGMRERIDPKTGKEESRTYHGFESHLLGGGIRRVAR